MSTFIAKGDRPSVLISDVSSGNIPQITVIGKTIPEVYEASLTALWDHGCEIKTQYDKPDDPPSRDCSVILSIEEPFTEPRIYKSFPGGPIELEKYRLEVVHGIHDDWIDPFDKCKWPYTYHDRLFSYSRHYPQKSKSFPVNQIAIMIERLAKEPYSRQIEAITWYPWFDGTEKMKDPPCLQRLWCRILETNDGIPTLNMNFDMRSWDAFKAAYMNMYAFSALQRYIANEVSALIGKEVKVGCLKGKGDSYHIYGSDFENPKLPLSFQGFLGSLEKRTWEERVTNSDDSTYQEMFLEARHLAAAQIDAAKNDHGLELPKEMLKNLGYDVNNFPYPREWDL